MENYIQSPLPPTNPFEPARLSPLPMLERACALPYELTWSDLQPGLPGFFDHPELHAQAFESYAKQGLNGGPNSCILTLRYPTAGSALRSETVFLKRAAHPAKMEARKYQFLADRGFPVPDLLAVIEKGDAEIIMLEFLPDIGIDFRSRGQVDELLHLAAQLNAIQNPPDFFSPAPGLPQAEFDVHVQRVLTDLAHDHGLPFTLDVARWFEAYQSIEQACRRLPVALNHNQFFFQQVGWAQRESVRQLVMFDLETMSLTPRFSDVAGILKSLAAYTGRAELELFEIYIDRLRQLTGLDVDIHQAIQELKEVQILDMFCSLPWLWEAISAGGGGLLQTTPALAVTGLHDDLTALGML